MNNGYWKPSSDDENRIRIGELTDIDSVFTILDLYNPDSLQRGKEVPEDLEFNDFLALRYLFSRAEEQPFESRPWLFTYHRDGKPLYLAWETTLRKKIDEHVSTWMRVIRVARCLA